MNIIPTRSELRKEIAFMICRELFWTKKTLINEVTQKEYEIIADDILDIIDNDRG